MKRVSHLTALALLVGLASSCSGAADMAASVTLQQLQQRSGIAIDTRQSAF